VNRVLFKRNKLFASMALAGCFSPYLARQVFDEIASYFLAATQH